MKYNSLNFFLKNVKQTTLLFIGIAVNHAFFDELG